MSKNEISPLQVVKNQTLDQKITFTINLVDGGTVNQNINVKNNAGIGEAFAYFASSGVVVEEEDKLFYYPPSQIACIETTKIKESLLTVIKD